MSRVPVDDGTAEYNSYLVDFFKEDDAEALKRDNGILACDFWCSPLSGSV